MPEAFVLLIILIIFGLKSIKLETTPYAAPPAPIHITLVLELILKRKSFFKDDINPIPSVFAPIILSLTL